MKVLTLTQPYASLVAYGDKRVETRSWRSNHRGPLLIHAASTLNGVGGKNGYLRTLGLHVPDEALERLSRLGPQAAGGVPPGGLPLGAVVAVSYLKDCEVIDEGVRQSLSPDELAVGNYSDGRYAWRLRKAISFPAFACRGKRGVWEIPDADLPDYIRRACRAITHAVVE